MQRKMGILKDAEDLDGIPMTDLICILCLFSGKNAFLVNTVPSKPLC